MALSISANMMVAETLWDLHNALKEGTVAKKGNWQAMTITVIHRKLATNVTTPILATEIARNRYAIINYQMTLAKYKRNKNEK